MEMENRLLFSSIEISQMTGDKYSEICSLEYSISEPLDFRIFIRYSKDISAIFISWPQAQLNNLHLRFAR